MTDPDQHEWWRESARLAGSLIVGIAVLAAIPPLLAGWFDQGTLFALPFGTFLMALATPVVIAIAIFWFSDVQARLDRDTGVTED